MKKAKLLKTLLIPTIGITAIGTIGAVSTSCSCSPVVLVTGVSLDKESLPLGIGESETLAATVLPENATDKSVTWSSSDSSVATIDNNGNVTAVGEGQATITVTTNDGAFTDACQVTVHQKIHVIGVLLNKGSLVLVGAGDSDTLTATVLPENATDKSVTWSSSNSSVASVDNDGNVRAIGEGSAKITVKTNDGGYEDYCNVTVTYTAASYICVTANADSTLELKNEGGNNPNLRYSADGKNWTTYSGILNIPSNEKIYLIGDNANGWSQSDQNYSCFNITGDISLSGNVMALLDDGTETISSIPNDYCFYGLFSNTTGITSVSKNFLPATELTEYCYHAMFYGCTSLITAPTLPATTLTKNCYNYMFAGCASLTTAPDLPATILASYCYFEMFENCKSLTTAPDLPATTLAESCYFSMFTDCASLTTAPDLPATTLLNDCYRAMFYGCSSLTKAPNLPATTLAQGCYWSMFEQCISLTTAPELPATTLADSCYSNMFIGCTSLTTAPNLPATTLANNCYESMFQGCTSLTTAPELPATTLADYCYHAMFYGCTSLTIAPDLLATKVAKGCYYSMFQDCTSLVSVKLGYTGGHEGLWYAFNLWVENVASVGTFYYNVNSYTIIIGPIELFGFPSGWTCKPY